MNHLTHNLDSHINDHFSLTEVEQKDCFFCLDPIVGEPLQMRVVGKNAHPSKDIVDCCEECFKIQTVS